MNDTQKDQIMQKLNSEKEREFDGLMDPVRLVYIDHEFLQDFRLGALIGLIKTQVEYDYIRSRIVFYNENKGDPITGYFPKLGFKEEDVDAYIKNPENWDVLCERSPFYTTSEKAAQFLLEASNHNLLIRSDVELEVYIGSNNLIYPVHARQRLAALFSTILDNVTINFITGSLYGFDEIPIENYDIYMVEKPSVFINHPKLMKKFEQMEMTGKSVLGLVEVTTSEEELNASSTTVDEALEATVEFANMFTKFAFVPRVILA